MQISGSLIATWGIEGRERSATIILPEVDEKKIKVGDVVWIEREIMLNISGDLIPEPITTMKTNIKYIAHFPQEKEIDEGIDVPLKFNCENPHIWEITNKINAIIDVVAKLAGRVK